MGVGGGGWRGGAGGWVVCVRVCVVGVPTYVSNIASIFFTIDRCLPFSLSGRWSGVQELLVLHLGQVQAPEDEWMPHEGVSPVPTRTSCLSCPCVCI
jgi:hypothetical protein